MINGGKVYADGITLHNTGLNGSNVVRINGGEFYLLDGQLIADDEYALYVSGGKVYLYSGKLSTTGRMTVVNDENSNIQICYSEKPLYFIDDTNLNWYIIENDSAIHLEDNLVMDLEYSDNPDGSDSKMLRNVTQIDNIANEGKKYLKIQTYKPSYLFSTDYTSRLLNKIRNDKITEMSDDAYTAVHFVNLADYDLTDISYSDYSAKGDGSVKAWVTGTELYIGGYGKIIAGKSLFRAFMGGYKIDKITGLEMLDTSNVTNMAYMFYACGSESTVFTLDLGDNFDTSKVKDMTYMFCNCGKNSTKFALDLGDNFDTSNVTRMNSMFSDCGYNSPTFTLDLGAKFDTSKVTNMYSMFSGCGFSSTAFTTLDLSTFTVNADTEIGWFANKIPVTKFIFGKGWRNATLPVKYPFANCSSSTPTEIVGATKNLLSYKWTRDNRIVTFTDNITYEIIPITENGGWATEGGTVTGGGTVLDGESITLTATVDEGYSFDGWYDGDTKVCDTAEFVVTNVTANKTYTAKFTKNQIVEPDPEPEEPEIPYLKWDGSTLTLVKKASAKCRVGIVYVGGATFDTNNINWDELVAAGKDYANLNSPVGYAIYGNFTKRTPGTRGNYVAFVKYTKEDGTTTADYITFNVKNAVSFERPSLSYNPKTRTLKMKGNVSSTIGVAYIGESEVDASNVTWNDFVKVGKLYPDENGSSGYTKVLNTLDYTKTFNTNGNYVAFIKYFDGNLNKSLAKYYTFTVDDYNLQPTDIPFALAEESQIILNTNGFDVAKVTIVYIGTDDVSITNWNEFSAAAAKFSDINGKELNQQYTNPKDGSVWKQKTAGWYGVYIRYNIDGERCNSYYTVEVK